MKKILLIAVCSALSGCANPYGQFYEDYTRGKNVQIAAATSEPKLIQGSNVEEDTRRMMEDGYSLLGISSFNASNVNLKTALKQAKKVHADSVIVYSQYTHTLSGSMPFTVPDMQTSYHSGTVSGYGGSASYFGSSTTYGSSIMYMPYHVPRYDYYATFWAKHKTLRLGVYCDDLTDELRREIGSNKGALIILVVKGSPAFSNDLLAGDVIRKCDDMEVVDGLHFLNILDRKREQQIKLEILRGGKSITKNIQLNSGSKTQERKQKDGPNLSPYYPAKPQDDVEVSAGKESSILVKGIVWSSDRPSALINGQIVREGGSVSGARVTKITRDSVEFEKDGTTWTQGVSR